YGTTLKTIAGATTQATGASFTNLGTNEILTGGTFVTDNATRYEQSLGTTSLAGGTLRVPAGFVVEGVLKGAGASAADLANEGVIAPEGAGMLVQGAYRQTQAGARTRPLGGARSA